MNHEQRACVSRVNKQVAPLELKIQTIAIVEGTGNLAYETAVCRKHEAAPMDGAARCFFGCAWNTELLLVLWVLFGSPELDSMRGLEYWRADTGGYGSTQPSLAFSFSFTETLLRRFCRWNA
jgi:hypothetical protein